MEKKAQKLPAEKGSSPLKRRDFLRLSALGVAGFLTSPSAQVQGQTVPTPPVETNIGEILKIPRTKDSMPGPFPGRVVRVDTPSLSQEDGGERVYKALTMALLSLTGEKSLKKAWRRFVSPKDIVGLKLNPIGGTLLSNNPLLVGAVIRGLREAGLPPSSIFLWDRRLEQLGEAGFTEGRFPGIKVLGTEGKGPDGEYFTGEGKLWALENLDMEAPSYEASLEGKYDQETLPFMLNEGTRSYFSKIATRRCTKIINLPVLKNAGVSVTLSLKNLTYGALSNTGRLHKIWHRSIAEGCAFPCLRDKAVLHIVDGTKACYDGGPSAVAKFIWSPNLLLLGSDPVSVDSVGYDFLIQERIERGIQKADSPRGREFLRLAESFGLGVADPARIVQTRLTSS